VTLQGWFEDLQVLNKEVLLQLLNENTADLRDATIPEGNVEDHRQYEITSEREKDSCGEDNPTNLRLLALFDGASIERFIFIILGKFILCK
jgi:hypothetical protein